MADVNVSIALAGITEIEKSLAGLRTQFDGLGQTGVTTSAKLNQMAGSIAGVGTKLSLMAVPIALIGTSIVKSGADFESAMNKIQVTTGATAEEMLKVEEAAKRIGSETTFSAGEAADAMINLGKNGVTLQQQFDGVLDATVNLAAATGTSLGGAADIAAKAMKQFGADASDLPTMMDQLFNATQESTFELGDMALALSQGGGAAATAGLSFGEFNTAMVTVSNNVASGSDAGTAFKSMLIALLAPTKEAARLQQVLGINIKDAHGNIIPMRDIVGQLTTALEGQGGAQKLATAATLVGSDAQRGITALVRGGVAEWDKNTAAVNKSGTTAEAAAKMMEGFWGAVDKLTGAIELLGIALVDSGFIPFLANMIEQLAKAVEWVSNLDPLLLNIGATIAGVVTVGGPILLFLSGMLTLFAGLAATTGVAAVTAVLALLTAAVVLFHDEIGEAFQTALKNTLDLFGVEGPKNVSAFKTALELLIKVKSDVSIFFTDLGTYADSLISKWDGTLKGAVDIFDRLLEDLGTWAVQLKADLGAAMVAAGSELIAKIGIAVSDGGKALLTGILDWVTGAQQNVGFVVGYIVGKLAQLTIGMAQVAIDTAIALWTKFKAAIETADWLAIGQYIITALANALVGLVQLGLRVGGAFVSGLVDGIRQAFAGNELEAPISHFKTIVGDSFSGIPGAIETGLAPVPGVVERSLHAAVAPVKAAGTAIAGVGDDIAKTFEEIVNEISAKYKEMADAIADDESLGLNEKMEAFSKLGQELQGMGEKGKKAANELRDAIKDTATEAATADIAAIMDDVSLSFADQGVALEQLMPKYGDLGKFGKEGLDKIGEAAKGVQADTAKYIQDADWGIDAKMAAFADLEVSMKNTGNTGVKAFTEFHATVSDTLAAGTLAEIEKILSDTTLTIEQQIEAIVKLRENVRFYGEDTDEAFKLATESADDFNATLADSDVQKILDDTTKNLYEQYDAIDAVAKKAEAGGDDFVAAAKLSRAEADKLAAAIANQANVINGVATALTNNELAWGGWGDSAGRIVEGFSTTAEQSISDFIITGTFDLETFGDSIKRILADEAAKAIVSFASTGIKAFADLGVQMFTSMVSGAAGMDIAAVSAWFLNVALAPILLVVLAIAAAIGIFVLAGGDLGDLMNGLIGILEKVGGLLLTAILAPINLLIAGFDALVKLLELFVKWLGSVGDALGKGDLKDLFKMFEGFNPLKGIKDFFGDIFGGLFHKGGLIPGTGDIAIRAQGGEYVVNRKSTEMFGPLLELLNARGLGESVSMAAAQAAAPVASDPFRAFAEGGEMMLTRPTLLLGGEKGPEVVSFRSGSSGTSGAATIVNKGILIADRMTMNALGKKLFRQARKDNLRLTGR